VRPRGCNHGTAALTQTSYPAQIMSTRPRMGFEKPWRSSRMLIGYARVSTEEQLLALQLDALKAAGCRRVFTDKVSTTKADHPGLSDAVSHLRHGDGLMIWKLDRLGRSVKGLVDFVA